MAGHSVDRSLVVSGMGELPAIIHLRDFGLAGFTSGCVCIAPRAADGATGVSVVTMVVIGKSFQWAVFSFQQDERTVFSASSQALPEN